MKQHANGVLEFDVRNPDDMREYRRRFQPYTHFVVDLLYPFCMAMGVLVLILGIFGLVK